MNPNNEPRRRFHTPMTASTTNESDTGTRRGRLVSTTLALLATISVLTTACGGGGGAARFDGADASTEVVTTTVEPTASAAPEAQEPVDQPTPATNPVIDAAFEAAEFTTLEPLPYEPTTAWEALELGLDADGTVPKDVALQAFALVYGPLPGVEVPEGEPGVTSGTMARLWIARWYDELTADQQTAVDRALLPLDADGRPPEEWFEELDIAESVTSAGEASRAQTDAAVGDESAKRSPASSTRYLASGTNPAQGPKAPAALEFVPSCTGGVAVKSDAPGVGHYRKVVEEELALLETKLGPLGIPVYLSYGRGAGFADASAENDDCRKPASWCAIRIMPVLAKDPGPEVRSTLTHELVHCYQGAAIGIYDFGRRANWLVEGFAEFVANSLHPGESPSSQTFLRTYYNTAASGLFPRSYSAAGFFHHVASSGGDPFATFVAAMREDDQMAEFLTHVGTSSRQAFSESWASSMARDVTRGAAWDEHAPEVPDYQPPVAKTSLANGNSYELGAVAAGTNLHRLELSADVVLFRPETGAMGRASWDGTGESMLDGLDDAYCNLAGGCECPDEGGPAEPDPTPAPAVLLAVNGIESPSVIRTIGMSLDDWCGDNDPDDTNDEVSNAPVDSCVIGQWTSDGWTSAGPLPEFDQIGGSGAIANIEPDGTIAWDFDPMQPMTSYDDFTETTFSSVSSGQAAGSVEARGGVWMVEADLSGVEGQVLTDGPIPSIPAGAGPAVYILALDGAYTCGGDLLSYTTTDPAMGDTVAITFHRNH